MSKIFKGWSTPATVRPSESGSADSVPIFAFVGIAILVMVIGHQIGLLNQRIAALEKGAREEAQFHGFLYTLNPQGNWDRVRTNQIEICRTSKCVVYFVAEPGNPALEKGAQQHGAAASSSEPNTK